jgi:hypothetical protein
MKNKQKPYWEMATAELRETTKEFDAEMLGLPGKPLTAADRRLLARARRRGQRAAILMRSLSPELATALQSDPIARTLFQSMPPSHQTAYAKYVAQAKKPQTRRSRAAQSLAMIRQWARKRSHA